MKWLKQYFSYILILALVVETIILLNTGFAGIRFNDKDKGLRFYNSKPYLKVTKKNDGVILDVEVFHLPDYANPQYIHTKDGIGTNKFKLSLENGMLTSFENETDSKTTETITAVSNLIDKLPEGKELGQGSEEVIRAMLNKMCVQDKCENTAEIFELDENFKWRKILL